MTEMKDLFSEIQDIGKLIEIKEKLKNDVMNPTLKWQERMNLYQTIQGINQKISFITGNYPIV